MKTKEGWKIYLSEPSTVSRVVKTTYLGGFLIQIGLSLYWLWRFWGQDIGILAFLWIFMAYKLWGLYKNY